MGHVHVAKALGKGMGQVHGERVLGRDMWQGYRISTWDKGMGRGMGQEHGTQGHGNSNVARAFDYMGQEH